MSSLYVNRGGVWKTDTAIREVYINDAGTWRAADSVFHKEGGVWKEVWQGKRTATITGSVNNITIGSGGYFSGETTTECTLIINSGVAVGSTSTGSPAINIVSNFINGLTIINNGYIHGCGGKGGAGGGDPSYNGSNGGTGGNAIHSVNQSVDIKIQNNGTIASGGGGGGGGATFAIKVGSAGGSGGGGGAGVLGGGGGTGGQGTNEVGQTGKTGSRTTGGAGGAGGSGGAGGRGGNQGSNGTAGVSTANTAGAGGIAGYWTTNASEINVTGNAPLGRVSG